MSDCNALVLTPHQVGLPQESPRWLVSHDRHDEAFEVLKRIRKNKYDPEDIYARREVRISIFGDTLSSKMTSNDISVLSNTKANRCRQDSKVRQLTASLYLVLTRCLGDSHRSDWASMFTKPSYFKRVVFAFITFAASQWNGVLVINST
jgi:hypothetical protein